MDAPVSMSDTTSGTSWDAGTLVASEGSPRRPNPYNVPSPYKGDVVPDAVTDWSPPPPKWQRLTCPSCRAQVDVLVGSSAWCSACRGVEMTEAAT
jgi:hypothetical protein